MDYTIYYHKHEREGYEHTEYLCFRCATFAATETDQFSDETIHPVLTREGKGRKDCSICKETLNWIDT